MRIRYCRLVTAALAGWLALTGPAAAGTEHANEHGTGGLVFAPHPTLKLAQQELVISADRVGITYTVRNDAETAQTILVTFPLPDLEAGPVSEGEVQLADDPTNFVKAAILVDGQPVMPQVEQRAYALGLDITALLIATGLDIFPATPDLATRIANLSEAHRLEMLQRGILKEDGGTSIPAWTLKTVAHWRQTFAPRRSTTLQHSYRPIIGVTTFGTEALPGLRKRVCLDTAQEQAIGRLPNFGRDGATIKTVSYVASTSGESLGPAQRFKLIVETGDVDTVVATCREGLKRTGPMQLEWNASDYTIDDDLLFAFAR